MGRKSGLSQSEIKFLLNHPYLMPPFLGGWFIFFGKIMDDNKFIFLEPYFREADRVKKSSQGDFTRTILDVIIMNTS